MKQLADLMVGAFGRYPTQAEVNSLKTGLPADAQARLDLAPRVAAIKDKLCDAIARRTCEQMQATTPVYATPGAHSACANDAQILLRLLTLAAATDDLNRFAVQVKTWYVDFLGSIRIPPKDVYLAMTYLGQSLDGPLDPASAAALRRPLQMGMGIVEQAMHKQTVSVS